MSGLSSDMRDLEDAAAEGNVDAKECKRGSWIRYCKIRRRICCSYEWCGCDRIYSRYR